MSGILQEVMVGDGPTVFVTYTATVTIGDALPYSSGDYLYGYVRSGWYAPGEGSIASEVGGTADIIDVRSSSADFSNPTTDITISFGSEPADWANVTATKVTIDGVSRTDGYIDGMRWVWSGDVFALRSKNGQALSVSIEGTA